MPAMPSMPSILPPFSWQSYWQHWQFSLVWSVVAAVLLAGYAVGLATARRRHGSLPVSPIRVGCWLLGVVLLVGTVESGIDVYGMVLFSVHMIEHLMLIMVVPSLLVLGHPLTVLRAALASPERFDKVVRSWPVAVPTHPLVSTALYCLVIVATHLTSFMDEMTVHPWLGGLEKVLYLVSGYLFCMTLLGYEPIRWLLPTIARIALSLIAMTADTVVGIVLMQADTNLFPKMEMHRPMGAPSALHDLHLGGGIMWAFGDGLMTAFAFAFVIVLVADPHRDRGAGSWLESVRRQTMADQVGEDAITDGADVDNDDEALAAYNRMLGRLGGTRE